MIRVIAWTGEIEIEGAEACEAASLAFRHDRPIDVDGRQCRIMAFDHLRGGSFGGVVRVRAAVEEVRS